MKVHCYLITTPEVEGFRDEGFVLLEVESLSSEFVASRSISLSIVNSKLRHAFILTLYASIISLKRGSTLNTHSNHLLNM